MTSLPQNAASLISSNNFHAKLFYNKWHPSEYSVTNNLQVSKPTFRALVLEGQKKKKKQGGDVRKQRKEEKWRRWCSEDGNMLPHGSVVDTVGEFYDALNARDTHKLKQLLLPYSVYWDLIFYGPHEGKQNVIHFLLRARDAMGQNIHLFVEEVIETDHLEANVHWQLARWEDKKIPFTNGNRCFTFEKVEGKLLISKIIGVEELPVKPSEIILKLLKTVGMLLDRYPLAAQIMLKAYGSDEGKHEDDMHFNLFGQQRR